MKIKLAIRRQKSATILSFDVLVTPYVNTWSKIKIIFCVLRSLEVYRFYVTTSMILFSPETI